MMIRSSFTLRSVNTDSMESAMTRRYLSTTGTRAALSASASQRPILVGPPHSVSNLRPVIYSTVGHSRGRAHPYSVTEFSGPGAATGSDLNWQVAWTLTGNDRSSHAFWLDSNTRFNAAKQAVLDSHASIPIDDPQAREVALDAALSRFYRAWLAQEDRRQRTYTWNMYTRTLNGIRLAFKNQCQQLLRW